MFSGSPSSSGRDHRQRKDKGRDNKRHKDTDQEEKRKLQEEISKLEEKKRKVLDKLAKLTNEEIWQERELKALGEAQNDLIKISDEAQKRVKEAKWRVENYDRQTQGFEGAVNKPFKKDLLNELQKKQNILEKSTKKLEKHNKKIHEWYKDREKRNSSRDALQNELVSLEAALQARRPLDPEIYD